LLFNEKYNRTKEVREEGRKKEKEKCINYNVE
jgi:hypothetical protein